MEEKQLHEQQAQGYGIAQATGGSIATVTIYQAPAKPGDPNRQRMLAKVRAFWISGVLEPSLHGTAPLALRLQEQSEVLANPWALVVQESIQPAHPLPPDLPLLQVYEEAGGGTAHSRGAWLGQDDRVIAVGW